MSMSVGSSTASPIPASAGDVRKAQERRASIQMAGALHSGDLGAAQAAYTKLTAHLPERLVANPKTAINQLGKALQSGDLDAAKKAFGEVAVHVHEYRAATATPPKPPVSETQSGSTGSGSVGTLVNAFA